MPVQVGLETPPGADVEPLGPAEEAEVMLTQPLSLDLELGSGCLAWKTGKVSRSACKREKKKARQDESLASSIFCKQHLQ